MKTIIFNQYPFVTFSNNVLYKGFAGGEPFSDALKISNSVNYGKGGEVKILFPKGFSHGKKIIAQGIFSEADLRIPPQGVQILMVDRRSDFTRDVFISKPQGYSHKLLNIESDELNQRTTAGVRYINTNERQNLYLSLSSENQFNSLGTSEYVQIEVEDAFDKVVSPHIIAKLSDEVKTSIAENWVFSNGVYSLRFKNVLSHYDIHVSVNVESEAHNARSLKLLFKKLSLLESPALKKIFFSTGNKIIPMVEISSRAKSNAILICDGFNYTKKEIYPSYHALLNEKYGLNEIKNYRDAQKLQEIVMRQSKTSQGIDVNYRRIVGVKFVPGASSS